jgi:hypothetical protein
MKIAIVGGGWVGCHLASKLSPHHEVKLFDKNEKLFLETSYSNQNRLHRGFHYARNFKTRELCRYTFAPFLLEYGHLTSKIEHNIYSVPIVNSLIDFQTYLQIFRDYDVRIVNPNLQNIEGSIEVDERYIDFDLGNEWFNLTLRDLFEQREFTYRSLVELSKDYDLVINATNNSIKDFTVKNSFYESTITLLYEKIGETNFGALTLVDGNLFSIYPYRNTIYTVTDVDYTPLRSFKDVKSLERYTDTIDDNFVNERRKLVESKISVYYPQFKDTFRYHGFFISTKSKIQSSSASRYPIITKNDKIINCFTGKIQGIFVIEDYIKDYVKG